MMRRLFVIYFATLLFSPLVHASSTIKDVSVKYTTEGTRVEIKLSRMVKYSYFSLKSPERLVIDLPNTQGDYNYTNRNPDKLVRKVRKSTPKNKSDARVVVDLRTRAEFKIGTASNTLWVQFDDKPIVAGISEREQPIRPLEIIVALDAGHGGRDPGSVGPQGTFEKHVVLSVAKKVAKKIDATQGMKAVLVRTGDYYIKPSRRPEIAREKFADLLISIHADAFTSPQPSGASVWVLNNRRANSELGKWLQRTEQHSELLGGAGKILEEGVEDEYLTRTLLDMSTESSQHTSFTLSKKVLDELGKVTNLHKKTPQHASLAVLTAPDIPSILVEVGFISNPRVEKNLNWGEYRERLAESIYTAIVKYFRKLPPEGTAWALQKKFQPREHRVSSGESLSVIAKKYRVSVPDIKRINGLNSDLVRVGQRLKIPQG